ncbi:MAG: hypothetical protein K8R79_02030 [Calditrichales bacterium]|nr:hypothetical protein [Calditrichales bacterium]
MKSLTAIWKWFNGNKLLIGTLCIALAPFFPDYTFIHGALLWAGGTFGTIGLGHKLAKGTKNT